MKKLFIFAFVGMFLMSFALVSADPGKLWITEEDCISPSGVNAAIKFDINDSVWVKGTGFKEGEYLWDITGQPGEASCDSTEIVASDFYNVDASGDFCFEAYKVLDDDCGVYKVNFGDKNKVLHVVPEFGFYIGMMTILSAVGIFFVVRRD